MTSIGPYSKAYDNTHMYSFVDYRSSLSPKLCTDKDSAMGFLENKNFSKFRAIVKNAGVEGSLDSPQYNSTLFVVPDSFLSEPLSFYQGLDRGTCRTILNVSSLRRKINGKLLRSSPVSYYTNKDFYNRGQLYVTNISGVTKINECARVIEFDIERSNSIIHIVNCLLTPNASVFIN